MNGEDSLAVLRSARARDVPWRDIVTAFRALESSSATDEHGRPWIKVAAEFSGYTGNQIREMERTLAALEILLRQDLNISEKSVLTLPFTHLEIIARIAKADPKKAGELLTTEQISSGRSFRDLRNIYYELRDAKTASSSPRSAGHQAARKFQQACLKALSIEDNVEKIFGHRLMLAGVKPAKWPDGFQYANPNFIFMDNPNRLKALHAFDCLTIFGDVNNDASVKIIQRISLASTFFQTYYLIFPDWSNTTRLYSRIMELQLRNVGILILDGETLHVDQAPIGPPYPDRQGMPISSDYLMRRLKRSLL